MSNDTTVTVVETPTSVSTSTTSNAITVTSGTTTVTVAGAGIQGAAGTQILNGNTVPDPLVGRIGDYFLDQTAMRLYGPKTQEDGWGAGVPLGDAGFVNQFDLDGSADGQALIYDGATALWKPKNFRYVHNQGVASATWTINHNLGVKPSGIAVVDSADTIVIGDIQYTNTSQVVISFSSPFAGKAYLS